MGIKKLYDDPQNPLGPYIDKRVPSISDGTKPLPTVGYYENFFEFHGFATDGLSATRSTAPIYGPMNVYGPMTAAGTGSGFKDSIQIRVWVDDAGAVIGHTLYKFRPIGEDRYTTEYGSINNPTPIGPRYTFQPIPEAQARAYHQEAIQTAFEHVDDHINVKIIDGPDDQGDITGYDSWFAGYEDLRESGEITIIQVDDLDIDVNTPVPGGDLYVPPNEADAIGPQDIDSETEQSIQGDENAPATDASSQDWMDFLTQEELARLQVSDANGTVLPSQETIDELQRTAQSRMADQQANAEADAASDSMFGGTNEEIEDWFDEAISTNSDFGLGITPPMELAA